MHRVQFARSTSQTSRTTNGGSPESARAIEHLLEQLFDTHDRLPDGWAADVAAAMDEDVVAPLLEHRRLRPLLFHLLNNLSKPLESEEAATVVNVEERYFSRFFQREAGFTFTWWKREVRIRLAMRLLLRRGRNIDSIALAVGYGNDTTFRRAFKQCSGVCPRVYQRRRSPLQTNPARLGADEADRPNDSTGWYR